ncbi:MAG: methylmalonyl-CoA mutase, partial [Candidatus Aminicenantes bacterium]|nr:methylmalonyl-CoA mutase [Candidatus Aminicenantes bacterium]
MRGQDSDRAPAATASGIPVKNHYAWPDIESWFDELRGEKPGDFPFTRGIHPTMYRERLWTMRQYAGFGTAEESNRRYRYLLAQGQTGLSVAFDLPTQIGLDSDHPRARGEVGRVGVAVSSLPDLEVLLRGIPLERVSVSMTINSTAAVLLAMLLALADKRGVPRRELRGTIQNDVLKEYIARGTYIFPPRPSLKVITDILSFCRDEAPRWNTMSISGYHIREAGATAVQEIAFTLANAAAYIRSALEAGLAVDDFAPRLSFFLAAHNDVFEETAKFRAARRLWARMMKDRFGARNPLSWKFRFHVQTSGSALLAQEPENNVVRITLQALAAVLGGAQSLHTNARDEALALPSEESARISLRTQQVLAFESGTASTADPLGGSYWVESLTRGIEERAAALMKKIEDMGGMLPAIERGFVQREIQESAFQFQKQVESGERVVVGLNRFRPEDAGTRIPLFAHRGDVERTQRRRLAALRRSRSSRRAAACLAAVARDAEHGE